MGFANINGAPTSYSSSQWLVGATLSWFDDCGHSPFCEDAPRFNDELMGFVQSCQRAGAA